MENTAANDTSFKPILDLQKSQLQQLNVLKSIEYLSMQDTFIQAAQLAEEKAGLEDDAELLEELKKVNTNLLKFGQNLKESIPAGSSKFSADEGDGYGESAFSFRNLFDLKRGSGGVIDTYLSQKEDAKAYKMQKANTDAYANMHTELAKRGALGDSSNNTNNSSNNISNVATTTPKLIRNETTSTTIGGVNASERQEEAEELAKLQIDETKEQTRLLGAILNSLTGIKSNTQAKPNTQSSTGGITDVLGDVGMAVILKKVAGFVFSAASLKLLLAAGLAASVVKLGADFRKGKAESDEYKELNQKKKEGTLTPAEEQKLKNFEIKKASGKGPYSGNESQEVGRAVKSHMDKDTAEQTLQALNSEDPKEREWGEENLKEYGVTKKTLQLYYDKMYSKTSSKETRKGITLATASVQAGELQELKVDAAPRKIEPKVLEDVSQTTPPIGQVTKSALGSSAEPFVIGTGDASDLLIGEDGQKITYQYSQHQPYVWTPEEIKEKVKILQSGGEVNFGTDFIPKDEKHRNPTIRNKKVIDATPKPSMESTNQQDIASQIGNDYTEAQAPTKTEATVTPISSTPKTLSPLEMAKLSPVERSRIRREQNLQARANAKAEKSASIVPEVSKTAASKGDLVYQQSTAAEDAKENAAAASNNKTSAPSIVSAPTTINSNRTQVNNGKPDIRNSESSFNKFMDNRYAY